MRPCLYWNACRAGSRGDLPRHGGDGANRNCDSDEVIGETIAHTEALAHAAPLTDTTAFPDAQAHAYAFTEAAALHSLLSQQEQAHPVQQGE